MDERDAHAGSLDAGALDAEISQGFAAKGAAEVAEEDQENGLVLGERVDCLAVLIPDVGRSGSWVVEIGQPGTAEDQEKGHEPDEIVENVHSPELPGHAAGSGGLEETDWPE